MKSSRSFFFVTSLFLTGAISGLCANSHENWPSWRPSSGNGVAEHATPPIEWGDDKNIKWKTAIEGMGFSTPIIWGDKLFLLSAVSAEAIPNAATVLGRAQPPGGNANAGGGQRGGARYFKDCHA
jgi:hypothetical protein